MLTWSISSPRGLAQVNKYSGSTVEIGSLFLSETGDFQQSDIAVSIVVPDIAQCNAPDFP